MKKIYEAPAVCMEAYELEDSLATLTSVVEVPVVGEIQFLDDDTLE